jgi:hypothetical protein
MVGCLPPGKPHTDQQVKYSIKFPDIVGAYCQRIEGTLNLAQSILSAIDRLKTKKTKIKRLLRKFPMQVVMP